jgi:ankyrin repeat protein
MPPIMHAIVMNDLKNIQILSKEDDFDINKKYNDFSNKTIFIKACSNGNLKIVKYLVSLGCDMNVRDDKGKTGFLHTCSCGHLDIIKYLKSLEYDIFEKNDDGYSGLDLPTMHGRIETIKFFVSSGFDIHEQNSDLTPFLLSCYYGDLTIIKYFISLGNCDEDDQDNRIPPFILVCQSKNLEAVKYLISEGYNINKTVFGQSGYDIAYNSNNILLVVLLLEYGCKITTILQKNENLDLVEAIENRIQQIEKSKQTIVKFWIDIDMFIIEIISEFAYGLHNLKKPAIFASTTTAE